LTEYPVQGRAGSGVIAMKLPTDAGVAAAVTGKADDIVVVLTNKHRPKQLKLATAPLAKRAGKGEGVIAVWNKEIVAAVVTFQRPLPTPELVPV